MGQCNVFFFCVLHIFQNFPCTLGEKSKSVSFSRVYVCVKAKLTLVSFFLLFFYAPSPRGKCFKCFPFFRGPFPGALLRIWSFCIFCINNPYCTLDCLLHCNPLLYFTLMPLTPYVAMAAEDWEWRRVDLGDLLQKKKTLIFLGHG